MSISTARNHCWLETTSFHSLDVILHGSTIEIFHQTLTILKLLDIPFLAGFTHGLQICRFWDKNLS